MEVTWLARSGTALPGLAGARTCYRIPALAVTATGRVVCMWDVREDWRDLPGAIDLVYRLSDDGGLTWGEVRVFRAHESERGYGDASLIADPASGRTWCWYVSSVGRSFFTAEEGPDGDGLDLWLASSTDDGLTWTHQDLTRELKPADVRGMFAASGNGIVLRGTEFAGRLVQPFVMRTGEGDSAQHWAVAGWSDDGGESWRLGARIGPDCDENKVVETSSGGVLLHARARPRRRRAWSVDGGVTFGVPEVDPALVDPACNGGVTRWGDLLVCSLLDDERDRRRLVLRLSDDDGVTWGDPVVVDAGAAGYSVVAELPDGSLGLAYEAGDYEGVVFCRISRIEAGFDGGPVTLVPRHSSESAAKPPEVGP